ncbi:MAG: hypothetical protein ACKV19_25405 [Verrucomicrobiales bacterium]
MALVVLSFNGVDGIIAESDRLIAKNNCRQNGRLGIGIGIRVSGSQNRIDENNTTGNVIGVALESGGNILIRNAARSSSQVNYSSANDENLADGDPFAPADALRSTMNKWVSAIRSSGCLRFAPAPSPFTSMTTFTIH